MKLSIHNSPYIRYRESSRTVMGDTIIALAPLYFMAYFYYGVRVLAVGGLAIGTCVAADWFCSLLTRRHVNFRDLSPVVTGMVLSLLMPAAVGYSVVVMASLFAILIVKAPFGGTGNNLFNPAAAGVAFATVCWTGKMFSYTQPLDHLPLMLTDSVKFLQGPAATLKLGGVPNIGSTELLLGNFPGPMGATNILIILACLVYLLVRKNVKWYVPLSYLGVVAVIAAFARPYGVTMIESACFELASGSLLFVAVYMLSEPVSLPKRGGARFAYGVTAGVVTMLFRYFGTLEQSAVFALLLMNAVSPAFDAAEEWLILRKGGDKLELEA